MNNFMSRNWDPINEVAQINDDVGQKIQTVRTETSVTQIELGKILGISSQQINNYETGWGSLIPCGMLFLISQFFNVPIQNFFPQRKLYFPAQSPEKELKTDNSH